MGDWTISRKDCSKCGGKGTVEVFDQPSAMDYSEVCEECGWKSKERYYELEPNNIYLLTPENYKKMKQALKNKLKE